MWQEMGVGSCQKPIPKPSLILWCARNTSSVLCSCQGYFCSLYMLSIKEFALILWIESDCKTALHNCTSVWCSNWSEELSFCVYVPKNRIECTAVFLFHCFWWIYIHMADGEWRIFVLLFACISKRPRDRILDSGLLIVLY